MSKFIGYKNELWKVVHEFEYTGTDQPFTLDPGTYLFICQGGTGATENTVSEYTIPSYGGVTYGVIDLNEQTTLHAVVGGNGTAGNTSKPGDGGFNGGAPGGASGSSSYNCGNGGGGASDIRLLEYDPNEYPTYDSSNHLVQPSNPIQTLYDSDEYYAETFPYDDYTLLDYLEFKYINQSSLAAVNTGYIPNENTKIVLDVTLTNNGQSYGERGIYSGGGTLFMAYYRKNNTNNFSIGTGHVTGTPPLIQNIPVNFDRRYKIEHSLQEITLYDREINDMVVATSTGQCEIDGSLVEAELVLFTLNIPNGVNVDKMSDTVWLEKYSYSSGKIYELKVYENDTLVVHMIPSKRNSDNYYGLYDVKRNLFFPVYTQSSTYIGGGSTHVPGYHLIEHFIHCGEYDRRGYSYTTTYTNTNEKYEPVYLDTGYVPTPNTEIVYDGVLFGRRSNVTNSCLFGGRRSVSGNTRTQAFEFYSKCNNDTQTVGYCRHDGTLVTSNDFPFGQRVSIRCYKETAEWSIGGVVKGSITMNDMVESEPACSIHLWTQYTTSLANKVGENEYTSQALLYSFKIYEVDPVTNERTLVRNFIPCERISDNVPGLFDLVLKKFFIFNTNLFNFDYFKTNMARNQIDYDSSTDQWISNNTSFASTCHYNSGRGVVDSSNIQLPYPSTGKKYMIHYWYKQHRSSSSLRVGFYFQGCYEGESRSTNPGCLIYRIEEDDVWLECGLTSDPTKNFKGISSGFNFSGTVWMKDIEVIELTDKHEAGLIKGEYVRSHPSIDSRIMVASGGGGVAGYTSGTTSGVFYGTPCCGGGVTGGFVANNGDYIKYEPTSFMQPNQTNGFNTAYAIPPTSRWNSSAIGSGGAGGGWFAGYSSMSISGSGQDETVTNNAGGGSSYIYTSSSYKPEGYNPPERYRFRNINMLQGNSPSGKIIIAKRSTNFETGDVIEFPMVGEKTSVRLVAGSYTVKCYGGDGGFRTIPKNAARGGYSQGDLNLSSSETIHVCVGGSGFPHINQVDEFGNDSRVINSPTSWNGGGLPTTSRTYYLTSGGGATDMRINGDTLYHRFIVAGGAGSEGTNKTDLQYSRPTVGGGLTGGSINGSSQTYYGDNNGPGTQTESPSDVDVRVAGSFGQGGVAYDIRDTITGDGQNIPGAGGGGWYGGSGTYPDTSLSDVEKGGCGGSGYVLTEDSYKPEGYQVSSDYYLTNAFTTQGGNNLNLFQTKAVIEVNNIKQPVLARDDDGYKYHDGTEWTLINPQPMRLTPEIFDTYSSSMFINDTGLTDHYSLYVMDESESIVQAKLLVTPARTRIQAHTTMTSDVLGQTVDMDYDTSIFNANVYAVKENGFINVYADVEKLVSGRQQFRLYSVILTGKGSGQQPSYHYYTAEELAPTLDCLPNNPCYGTRVRPRGEMEDYRDDQGNIMTAQWLLPTRVGGNKQIPIEYLTGLYSEGTTKINSAICVEYKRLIYILTSICKSDGIVYMEITTYNPETGRFHRLLHQEGSKIAPQSSNQSNPSFNGLLVDDEYFYVTVGYHSTTSYMTKVYFVKRLDGTVTTVPNPDGETDSDRVRCMNGDMNSLKWFDDQHTKFMFVTDSNTKMYIVDKSTRQMTRVDLTTILSNPYSLLSFDRFGDQIVIAYRNSSVEDFYLCSFNKNTNVVLFNTRVGPREAAVDDVYPNAAAFCYADGKYYYVSYNKLRVVDSTTGTVLKTYTVPWGKSGNIELGPAAYVNGAVAVPDMGTNYFYLFDIKKEMYTSIYTRWTIPLKDRNILRGMLPCKNNMIFYPGGASVLLLTYIMDIKYNIGYKYNQYLVDYTEDHISDFVYDENFTTFDDTCAIVSDGYLTYDVQMYDSNHITYVNISKSDYRYINDISFIKTE